MSGGKEQPGWLAQSKTTHGDCRRMARMHRSPTLDGRFWARDDKPDGMDRMCVGSVDQAKILGRPMAASHIQRANPMRCMQGAIAEPCRADTSGDKQQEVHAHDIKYVKSKQRAFTYLSSLSTSPLPRHRASPTPRPLRWPREAYCFVPMFPHRHQGPEQV